MARSTRTHKSVKSTDTRIDPSDPPRPKDTQAAEYIPTLLQRYAVNFDIKGRAAHALIEMARGDSADAIISAVLDNIRQESEDRDPDPTWCSLLGALAQAGVAGAIDAVLGVLGDSEEWETRANMAGHCWELDDERIIQGLLNTLKDEDEIVRGYAVFALTNNQGSRVLPEVVVAVTALLDDPDGGVCNDTAHHLKQLGAAARYALPSLRSMIQARQKQVVALARRSRAAEDEERTLLLSDLAEMRSSVRFLKHVEKSIIASSGA